MGSSRTITQNRLVAILIIIISVLILNALWSIASTTSMGGGDFWGYWSSSFLLRNGQNPYSSEAMRLVQTTQMDTGLGFTLMSWNPPTLFVIILPLTFLPITTAKFIWLIINLAMIAAMAIMLTKLYLPQGNALINTTFLFFVFTMPQILAGVYAGQVTILVSFGLIASMALIKKEKWFWAGAILILTSIKPHLIVLQVVYLLIHMWQKNKKQGWGGIFAAGIASIVVLFMLRPQLISDYFGLSNIAPTKWYTPTIGGWLSFMGITEIARYLIMLFLPIPFILAKHETKFSMELSIALLTLITIPFTFFGWSYDQAILLIPIAQVFQWLYQTKVKMFKIIITLMIITATGIIYYQKTIGIYEFYYVWIPLFWCLIFGITWYYSTRTIRIYEQTAL